MHVLSALLGPFCNRTWDGWLCWDDTPAGKVSVQNCPDYFPDFDPTGKGFLPTTVFSQLDLGAFRPREREADLRAGHTR